MKKLYMKINLYFINRPWAMLATSIFYYLTLSKIFNQQAHCIAWGWDFPLEKDVARQSWQERYEGEFYSIARNGEIVHNGNESCEDADYNKRTIVDPIKELSAGEIISQQEQEFKELLTKFSPLERAEKISGYLYERVDALLREEGNRDGVSIRSVIASMIKDDITAEFWVVHNKEDTVQESVTANIVNRNYTMINSSNKLSDGQKLLLAHINTQIAMVNLAEIKNMSFEQLVQRDDIYYYFLQKQYKQA